MSEDTPRAEKVARPAVPALDAMLGEPIRVLDDGFVRVVDYMGDDSAIVQAARTWYGRGTKRRHEDRGLIRYLMRHAHTTPFEMCEIKLHVRVPMDVWRQWIRHRTASVNEYSTRYSEAIDAAQRTSPEAWRLQSTGNRQGSSGLLPPEDGRRLSDEEAALQRTVRECTSAARGRRRPGAGAQGVAALDLYRGLLEDRPPEPAALPGTAHGRARAAGDPRVRNVIGEQIVAQWVPMTWEAFLDYRRGATSLSRIESAFLAAMASGDRERAVAIAEEGGFLNRGEDGRLKPNLEGRELEEKLERLGLKAPWPTIRDPGSEDPGS